MKTFQFVYSFRPLPRHHFRGPIWINKSSQIGLKWKIYSEKQIGVCEWTGKQQHQPSFQCHILFLFRLAPPFFLINSKLFWRERSKSFPWKRWEIEWEKKIANCRKSMVQVSYLPSTSYIIYRYRMARIIWLKSHQENCTIVVLCPTNGMLPYQV